MTPYKLQIWYINQWVEIFFNNFPKFELKLTQVQFEKIGWFWYLNGSVFLEKLVFVWVYFQIPWQHVPTKTKLENPQERTSCFGKFVLRVTRFNQQIRKTTWCMISWGPGLETGCLHREDRNGWDIDVSWHQLSTTRSSNLMPRYFVIQPMYFWWDWDVLW